MVSTEERRTSIVRVLLADDDRLYAEALKATLLVHDWIEVVGTAPDGAEAVDGYEATRRLRPAGSGARVLIATSSRESADATQAREAGAVDLIRKGEAEGTIIDAIRTLLPAGSGEER